MSKTEKKIVEGVAKNGMSIVRVDVDPGKAPRFSYSVGLFKTYEHPEVIFFGVPEPTDAAVLISLANRIKAGEKFEAGTVDKKVFEGAEVIFDEVSPEAIRERMLLAKWFYGKEKFPAIQMLWADREGIFPTNKNASQLFKESQPQLAPKHKTN